MRLPPLLALLLAVLLAGCAPLSGPTSAATPAGPVAQAERTHEYPATRAAAVTPQPAAPVAAPAPAAAVRAFATAYINWTAATVTDRLRALASLSVGQARAAMTLAASQTATDYELRRGGVANHGTVEAVAPLRGRPGSYVVVTRELTTATGTDAYRGLRPAWHVTLATVTAVGREGWALSAWQPEN